MIDAMLDELMEIVQAAKQSLQHQRKEVKFTLTTPPSPKIVVPQPAPIVKRPPPKEPILPSIPKHALKPLAPIPVRKDLSDLIHWYKAAFANEPFHLTPLSDALAKKVKSQHQKEKDYLILLPLDLLSHPFYQKLNETINRLIAPASILAIETATDQDFQGVKRVLADQKGLKQSKTWALQVQKQKHSSLLTLLGAELILLEPLSILSTPEKKKALWQKISSPPFSMVEVIQLNCYFL